MVAIIASFLQFLGYLHEAILRHSKAQLEQADGVIEFCMRTRWKYWLVAGSFAVIEIADK